MSVGGGGISAVVFDVGGVLTNDPFRVMAAEATDHGFELAEFGAIAVGRGDYGAGDHPWHLLERGEIELDDYNRSIDEMARLRATTGSRRSQWNASSPERWRYGSRCSHSRLICAPAASQPES